MSYGVNYKRYSAIDREECKNKCAAETELLCKSINYDKTNSNCYLVDVSMEDAQNQYKLRIGDSYSSYDLMVCEGGGKLH